MNNQHTEARSESLHILRLMVLVRLLRYCRNGYTFSRIREHLHERHLSVSDRQLQRDLKLLVTYFGVGSEGDEEVPRKKRWMQVGPESWRDVFMQASPGHTDRGPEPFSRGESQSPSIVHLPGATEVRGRELRLIRTLLIVEALPSEYEEAWASTSDIVHAIRCKGLNVTERTIQRDLLFIREHFLVLVKNERGRQILWQKLEDGDWEGSFEPRLPTLNLVAQPVVQDFLYSRPQPRRWLH